MPIVLILCKNKQSFQPNNRLSQYLIYITKFIGNSLVVNVSENVN